MIKFTGLTDDNRVKFEIHGIPAATESRAIAIRGKFQHSTVEQSYVIADGKLPAIATVVGPLLVTADGRRVQAKFFHDSGLNVNRPDPGYQDMVSHLTISCIVMANGDKLALDVASGELKLAA